MDAHHEQRVRQLLAIENNPVTGARGIIPPAAVEVVERAEKMLIKRTASSLRATEIAILLAASGIGPDEAKAEQKKPEPQKEKKPEIGPGPPIIKESDIQESMKRRNNRSHKK